MEVNDVLDDVVAKGVLHEDASVLGDALDQPELLIAGGVIDAALQHTAAVSVSANLDTLFADCIKDELRVRGSKLVEALLDDVVAVEILDELNNSVAKGLDYEVNLLRRADLLNHLLEGSCAVLVKRDAHHVLRRVLDQDSSFVVIAELEELLAQIITKRIRHELDDMLIGLEPNHVNLFLIAFLQLLLEIAAAMLVFAQLVNLAFKRLQRHVLVSRHGYKEGVSMMSTRRRGDGVLSARALTFAVQLSAMLDNPSLAIAVLAARGRIGHIAIWRVTLGRVAVSATSAVDVQLLHPGGERITTIRRRRGSARRCVSVEAGDMRARSRR